MFTFIYLSDTFIQNYAELRTQGQTVNGAIEVKGLAQRPSSDIIQPVARFEPVA